MNASTSDTDELISRVAKGDQAAVGQLLDRHRPRLRCMVAMRFDPRIAPRLDPSDVVQEALTEAARKLPKYIADRPLPFYPWLRQIAWERLLQLHRQHIGASKRSVVREQRLQLGLTDESVAHLASRLTAPGPSPSHAAAKAEHTDLVRAALATMESTDREVLVMWHLEELAIDEIASVLQLTLEGVKSRHRRALLRLTSLLAAKRPES